MPQVRYDISRQISPDAAVYPGDDPLGMSAVCEIGPEAPCNITSLSGWTTHFLTHLDAPRHFLADGATLDEIDLSRLITPAVIVDVDGPAITSDHIPADIEGKAVLFRTRNSTTDPTVFDENHVYVEKSAINPLVAGGANLIGIDYLSVDKYGDEEYPAHRGLLSNGILIIEGLNLTRVDASDTYTLVALPLKIKGADGSPVRAVLID
ncbi:cyclase family protein [Amycolatopsis japonica]|uniref:cyclase family protein n=1 Tax=Amycolatopsis japonica TaxID=208439 RepID=UPI0037A3B123